MKLELEIWINEEWIRARNRNIRTQENRNIMLSASHEEILKNLFLVEWNLVLWNTQTRRKLGSHQNTSTWICTPASCKSRAVCPRAIPFRIFFFFYILFTSLAWFLGLRMRSLNASPFTPPSAIRTILLTLSKSRVKSSSSEQQRLHQQGLHASRAGHRVSWFSWRAPWGGEATFMHMHSLIPGLSWVLIPRGSGSMFPSRLRIYCTVLFLLDSTCSGHRLWIRRYN